ncbi:hypothetical protein J2S54_002435 [Streptomyces sp. DSM 42143]|nr:hypothetical protein [Streptomyces sp. DSM 42143]
MPEIAHPPPHRPTDYATLIARATAAPAVLGLVLKGSHAHEGMVTEHSDHDVYAIVSDEREAALAGLDNCRSADLDLVVTTVEGFRRLDGLERYGIARGRVLLDRLDGEIASIVAAKGRLETAEASRAAAGWLDAYANIRNRSSPRSTRRCPGWSPRCRQSTTHPASTSTSRPTTPTRRPRA